MENKKNILFENWKKSAVFSKELNDKQSCDNTDPSMKCSIQNFWGVEESDKKVCEKKKSVTKKMFKEEFKMGTTQSKIKNPYKKETAEGPDYFMTTNTFFGPTGKTDTLDLSEMTGGLREGDPIWKTKLYSDPEDRVDLTQTFNRKEHSEVPPEIAEKLRVGKFNRIITPISEYSNALHNGTVFKNAKYTSC